MTTTAAPREMYLSVLRDSKRRAARATQLAELTAPVVALAAQPEPEETS